MERTLCEFNSDGVAAFQELMDAERAKVKSSQPAKVSEDFFSMVEKIAGTSELVQEVPGFGIMTSTVIDATLFDAADAICERRSISQKHFSAFEIERLLRQRPQLREKFFKFGANA